MMQWLPESISSYGHKIDDVIWLIYAIVGVWFVVVEVLLFGFLIYYRRSKSPKADYILGNTFKSLLWVIAPVILVALFDIGIEIKQMPVWDEIKIDRPANPDYTVRVVAQQFFWEFHYPGADGKLDTPDDLISTSDFYVPVNKKILVQLESLDVIHSFWVPSLRLKQDVVPGRRILAWFDTFKTGAYDIGCSQLCGVAHGNMRGELHVVSDTEFSDWLGKLPTEKDSQVM